MISAIFVDRPRLAVVIAVVIFVTALPSIIFSGLSFFTGSVFNFGNLYATTTIAHNGVQAPPHAVYGVLPLIVGTLSTSIIALVLIFQRGIVQGLTAGSLKG